MADFNYSRRGFIKAGAVGGISLYLAPLALAPGNAQAAVPEMAGRDAMGALKPRFRTDGIAKVTGRKIYGRDLRAADATLAGLSAARTNLEARVQ